MCSNIGTPNNHHFPFGTNGKIVVLGVPILKHFRVCCFLRKILQMVVVVSETVSALFLRLFLMMFLRLFSPLHVSIGFHDLYLIKREMVGQQIQKWKLFCI